MKHNHIKHALDNTLSSLYAPEHVGEELLALAKGGKKVKRKLPVAIILIVVLVIISAAAIAAVILSNKEFVHQVMAPMARNNASTKWTDKELADIERIAGESGVAIPEEIRTRGDATDGAFKEELMRSFLIEELGPYIATWSIGDQAWFDALLVSSGLTKHQTRVLPAEGEIGEAKALETAAVYIKGTAKKTADIDDPTVYQRYVEYRQFVDERGNVQPRMWYIRYESKEPARDDYDLVISPQGKVTEASVQVGVQSATDVATLETILDHYDTTYGLHYLWSQKVWESLQKDVQRSVDKHGMQFNMAAFILSQKYASPQGYPVSKQDAIHAAYQAVAQDAGIAMETLKEQFKANALLLMGKESAVWKVSLTNTNPGGGRVYDLRHAEIDAKTCKVLHVGHYEPGKNSLYEAYCLMEVLQDISTWPAHG